MRPGPLVLAAFAFCSSPVEAEWRAATPEVEQAARDPRIAAALKAVDAIDRAVVSDDHAAFAALLAPDLAVNNPGNRISLSAETAQRNREGFISYHRYERVIEFAGLRGDSVVLMGGETVVPKAGPMAGREVRRRFTDLWREEGGRWLLSARQATIVAPR